MSMLAHGLGWGGVGFSCICFYGFTESLLHESPQPIFLVLAAALALCSAKTIRHFSEE
jgi:hypothetical protein